MNSTDPSKSTGTCLGRKDEAQLTDTLSKCLSPYVCHDLHVCRTPPTPCALQAMDLPRQSGLHPDQWALSTQIWPIACRVHMHHRIVPVANPVGNPTI